MFEEKYLEKTCLNAHAYPLLPQLSFSCPSYPGRKCRQLKRTIVEKVRQKKVGHGRVAGENLGGLI